MRIDSNYHHLIQNQECCHCTTQQLAVRTGIEPIATDRQSVMLAVTPTNRDESYGLRTPSFRDIRRANHYTNEPIAFARYRRQDSNLQPLPPAGGWSIRPIGILLYFLIKELFRKRHPCCISQRLPVFLLSAYNFTLSQIQQGE